MRMCDPEDHPTLFDDVRTHPRGAGAAELELAAQPEAQAPPREPVSSQGKLSNRLGFMAETWFDAEVARRGGVSDKTSADDQPWDRIVIFDGQAHTVQIKYASCRNGRAQFNLGPRVGLHTAAREQRRKMSYRGRADFFVLVTGFRDRTEVYIIPARRLQERTSLTVTPGRYRHRQVRGPEPESYRDAWHLLAGKVVTPTLF